MVRLQRIPSWASWTQLRPSYPIPDCLCYYHPLNRSQGSSSGPFPVQFLI